MNKIIVKFSFKNIAIALAVAIFFIADRLFKALALSRALVPPRSLIADIFQFNFTKNYFISFSLPVSGTVLNIIVILIVLVLSAYIVYLLRRGGPRLEIVLLVFILFGALSNLIDRLALGYVVDYLELKYFTVFNLADAMISIPALILIFRNFRSDGQKIESKM